jgi:tRNA(Ile)-lysidine synthase
MAAPSPCPSPSGDQVARFREALETLGPPPGKMAIAVSGGPDSLALLLLAAAAFPGRIEAATVDHGLRPESAAEALHVAAICATLGCPHRTLIVDVSARGEGVQGEARRARYEALGAWMGAVGIQALMTGHQQDDQAETLLMRLLRGSGVAGLAGVRARRPLPEAGDGALVCRPLLGWRRADLAAIVRAAGLEAADDPSNRDAAYDRVRIRLRLAETPWLEPQAIARSAAALADAEEALDAMACRLFDERAEEGSDSILLRPGGIPIELLRRLVLRCLRGVAPDAAPRGDQIGAIVEHLRAGRTATLSGVKCSGGAAFRFEPAPPRGRARKD